MSTKNNFNIIAVLGQAQKQIPYPIDSSGSNDFHQGDLLWFDSSDNFAKALDTDAHAADFIGVAINASDLSLYTYAPTGVAQKEYNPVVLAGFGCIVMLKTTAGQTYAQGTALYIGADAQTVTTVVGTNSIGVVNLGQNPAITGAAGVSVPVLLTIKSPIAAL